MRSGQASRKNPPPSQPLPDVTRPPSYLLLLGAGLLAAGCLAQEHERPPLQPLPDSLLAARPIPAPVVDTTALPRELPDIMLPALEGDSLRLSSYRGRTVLLTFWATWCPPCRTYIPDLNQLLTGMHDDNIAVIGITVDSDPEKVRSFVAAYDIQYPVAFDTGLLSSALGGVYSLPTSFIISPEGHVLERITGTLPPTQLQSRFPHIAPN